ARGRPTCESSSSSTANRRETGRYGTHIRVQGACERCVPHGRLWNRRDRARVGGTSPSREYSGASLFHRPRRVRRAAVRPKREHSAQARGDESMSIEDSIRENVNAFLVKWVAECDEEHAREELGEIVRLAKFRRK